MFKWTCLCVLLLMSASAYAQEKDVEYLEQTWFAYFNQTRLTNKCGIWLELPQPSTFRNIDAIRLFVFHNLDFRAKE